MFLKQLYLQNFRSYTKSSFKFDEGITVIVGPNTSGKTNILEAISLLSLGKSMRGAKAFEMVKDGQEVAVIKGGDLDTTLGVTLTTGNVLGAATYSKKFTLNNVAKRQIDFIGNLKSSIFDPQDLELIFWGPEKRRDFLDDVLIQIDRAYRGALSIYYRALSQRNKVLKNIKEGIRGMDLDYWDRLLIDNGEVITTARSELINFLNSQKSDLGSFSIVYDKSLINDERLEKYKDAEIEAGVTLVGPQRDDIIVRIRNPEGGIRNLNNYGSRGEQRMGVLWMKMGELDFITKVSGQRPLLLLDDIFSELDDEHINLVLDVINGGQTIITTTHKEFLPKNFLKEASMIELE